MMIVNSRRKYNSYAYQYIVFIFVFVYNPVEEISLSMKLIVCVWEKIEWKREWTREREKNKKLEVRIKKLENYAIVKCVEAESVKLF